MSVLHRMTAILVSRFILDLQQANLRMLRQDSSTTSQPSSLRFGRVVGSLGSSFMPNSDSKSDSPGDMYPVDDLRNDTDADAVGDVDYAAEAASPAQILG